MNENAPQSGEIKVADISIAHLSRGLYRSTAAAFKELVSNAWDAGAETVRIDTNFPEFDYISCVDTGPGMSKEKFLDYFANKGIGFGDKRKGHKSETERYKRPIIGRLGVGMMAIGQLCYSFGIESHYKEVTGEEKAFKAEIDLVDLEVPDIDESISSDNKEEIKVGNWKLIEIPYDDARQGFRIYTTDIRETFRKEMQESIDEDDRNCISFSLPKLHKIYFDTVKRSIREMGAYLETIWELCILCPVPYTEGKYYPVDIGAFNENNKNKEYEQAIALIKEKQSQLKDYNFNVIFDGIELSRFIKLPLERDTSPRLFFLGFDEKVADRKLKYHGYIYGQTKAIKPYELNGIQIRLRNVGIGGYDSTFLKYDKKIETIRNRWVSGEIFVEDGLEIALNIDRDSFNEHDEHYKKLQEYLHHKLDEVFLEIESTAEDIRVVKHQKADASIKNKTWESIKKETNGKVDIAEEVLGERVPLLTYDESNKKIIMNSSIKTVRRKKPDSLIRFIMLAFFISERISKNEQERYGIFYELIREIMQKIA